MTGSGLSVLVIDRSARGHDGRRVGGGVVGRVRVGRRRGDARPCWSGVPAARRCRDGVGDGHGGVAAGGDRAEGAGEATGCRLQVPWDGADRAAGRSRPASVGDADGRRVGRAAVGDRDRVGAGDAVAGGDRGRAVGLGDRQVGAACRRSSSRWRCCCAGVGSVVVDVDRGGVADRAGGVRGGTVSDDRVVALPPAAIVPRLQVTVGVPLQVPCEGLTRARSSCRPAACRRR